MASTSTLGAASSCSSSTPRIYDVFLNFYGKDTRNNFVDHLHTTLKGKGIISFKDDEKLEQGKVILQELMQTIQNSQYAIVVMSRRYAFSKWCLIELTRIMECKSEIGLKVLPIFYNVDPSDVRKQSNIFEQAFVKHGEDLEVSKEQIKMWKIALTDVGNVAGWHINNSPESMVIEDICRKILNEWTPFSPIMLEGLVGMGSRVEKMISLLRMGLEDALFVGICGMGGIGKTTLARVIYDQMSPQFKASCFIANIREEVVNRGLIYLQTQIICEILQESELKIWNTDDGRRVMLRRLRNKDVFIILDDVDSKDQLEALLGRRNWYSPRSRVILTTRNRHLLQQYEDMVEIYELMELSNDESLKLFSQKAFKKDHPTENYMKLSIDIVDYAQGLPLALEVFGSYLYGRSPAAWEAARKQFKVGLDPSICKKLRINYDGLKDSQKDLFLDIACLFKGQCSINKLGVLKALHPYFDIDIEVLMDQCLIKGSKGYFKFHMHDLLREMGQQIVHQESPNELGKCSRLSSFDCINHISKHDSATDIVEKIILPSPFDEDKELSFEIFSKMTKLKMLAIGSFEDYDKSFWSGWHCNYQNWCGNASKFTLSNELCFLQWSGYPLQSLPTNFQPNNLVELRMPYSHIKGQWGGWKGLDNLKYIDMSYSTDLIEILDLSGVPNLESLNLYNCIKLRKVHASLGFLKWLRILRMGGCQSLERLPDLISSESLQDLNLVGCSSLKMFPNIDGHMTSLESLDLTGTMIRKLPLSCKRLSSLKYLNFCGSLRCWKFPELDSIMVSFFPPSWGHRCIKNFMTGQALHLGCNGSSPSWFSIPNIFLSPSRIFVPNLSSLKELDLSYLSLLDATLPDLSSLSSIKFLNLSGNKLTTVPDSICQLPNLVVLHLRDCKSLQPLQKTRLSSLRSLKVLNLAYCNLSDDMIPDDLGFLSSLQILSLSGNKFRKTPYLVQLSMLYRLYLDDCTKLQVFPKLPLNLLSLSLTNCPLLEICYHEMDSWTLNKGLLFSDCSFMAIYFDSDGKPYKILHVHPQKYLAKPVFHVYTTMGSIALTSGTPDWFNKRITSSFGTIEHCLQLQDFSWRGCALLILYEVHEHGISNNGISNGSTHTLPQFVCQFQVNKVGPNKSLLLCAPEVPFVGLNGIWVFINRVWFFENQYSMIKGHLESSIESCSLNVEVKECRARCVYNNDISEFFEVINSISPNALDLKHLGHLHVDCSF